MNENLFINTKECRKLTGVTTPTLHRWAQEGKIGFTKTATNRMLYNKQDVLHFINMSETPIQKQKRKIAYCRVSSKKQSDDLERQKEFFRLNFPEYDLVEDIASGINWNRKGLQTILELAMSGDVSEVVVAHRDRLCRFAFELIEFIFRKNDVKLIVLDSDPEKHHSETELSEDILSIIHVYSCRKMGSRRYSKQINEVQKT